MGRTRVLRVEGQGAVRRFSANAQGLAARSAESLVPRGVATAGAGRARGA